MDLGKDEWKNCSGIKPKAVFWGLVLFSSPLARQADFFDNTCPAIFFVCPHKVFENAPPRFCNVPQDTVQQTGLLTAGRALRAGHALLCSGACSPAMPGTRLRQRLETGDPETPHGEQWH